jgi:hypothetical protein
MRAYSHVLGDLEATLKLISCHQEVDPTTTIEGIYKFKSCFKLWICGLVLASRRTNFYKIPIFGLVLMSQNVFFFLIRVAKKLFIIKFF